MYTLPPLPYDITEFGPVLSKEIIQLHYEKHHAGYVKKLNAALEKKQAAQNQDLSTQIMIDEDVKFNGGGHLNHVLYWENLIPQNKGGGSLPDGCLRQVIVKTFGSLERCKQIITEICVSVHGSGWGWLGYCPNQGHLRAFATEKHDLAQTQKFLPLLCIDVWEHAYYLQYKNDRAAYVQAIWSIINWRKIEERLIQAQQ